MQGLPIDATVARVGDLNIGFPLRIVQEVLDDAAVTPVPLAEPAAVGLINVRGEIMTVIDLAQRLGVEGDGAESSTFIVVRTARGRVAVAVDSVTDVIRAPADAFRSTGRRDAEFFEGVYELPDRLVMILNVEHAVWLSAAAS